MTKENNINSIDNFFDSIYGLQLIADLKQQRDEGLFAGSILVRLENVTTTAVIDFIEKLFNEEHISYSMTSNYWNSETRIIIKNYNMKYKEQTEKLLDKCVILNTYINEVFIPLNFIKSYDICYQLNHFKQKIEMYLEAQKINFEDVLGSFDNSLFISELIYSNTTSKELDPNLKFKKDYSLSEYNFTFTKLEKELREKIQIILKAKGNNF